MLNNQEIQAILQEPPETCFDRLKQPQYSMEYLQGLSIPELFKLAWGERISGKMLNQHGKLGKNSKLLKVQVLITTFLMARKGGIERRFS